MLNNVYRIQFRGNSCPRAAGGDYLIVTGTELFPKELYYFDELPAHIVPGDVGFIIAASVILCTLGALLPALRAPIDDDENGR